MCGRLWGWNMCGRDLVQWWRKENAIEKGKEYVGWGWLVTGGHLRVHLLGQHHHNCVWSVWCCEWIGVLTGEGYHYLIVQERSVRVGGQHLWAVCWKGITGLKVSSASSIPLMPWKSEHAIDEHTFNGLNIFQKFLRVEYVGTLAVSGDSVLTTCLAERSVGVTRQLPAVSEFAATARI